MIPHNNVVFQQVTVENQMLMEAKRRASIVENDHCGPSPGGEQYLEPSRNGSRAVFMNSQSDPVQDWQTISIGRYELVIIC